MGSSWSFMLAARRSSFSFGWDGMAHFLGMAQGGGKHWLVARAALLLLVAAGGGDDSAGRCRAAPLALCGLVGREEEYDERTYGGGMHVEDGAKQGTSELGLLSVK
jgi:hypothetical protein